MEIGRGGYTNQKQMRKNKGVALVTVLTISMVVLLALGGIYLIVTNLMTGSQTTKTYTSVKEAVKGGVERAVLRIRSNEITPNDCNQGITIEYRINDQKVKGKLWICFIGVGSGYQLGGASDIEGGDTGYMYRIVSEVQEPRYNTQYRVEAVFVK